MALKKPAPVALTKVQIKEGVRVYTGIGHAPFQGGRSIHLPAGHADALIKTGHVGVPAAAAAASPGAAAEAELKPGAEHAEGGAASTSAVPPLTARAPLGSTVINASANPAPHAVAAAQAPAGTTHAR
jgi:hypothetical protein